MNNKLDRVLVLLEALCAAWDVKIPERPTRPTARAAKPKVTKKFTKGRKYGPRTVTGRVKPKGVDRHYEDWTREDDQYLLEKWRVGWTWEEIARHLGRTPHAVLCRCGKLRNP